MPFFRSTSQQIFAAATLLVLSFVAQTASLLHAEVHAFHTPSELCGVFHGVEKQPSLLAHPSATIAVPLPYDDRIAVLSSQISKPAARAFQARAPPSFWIQTQS